MSPPILIRPARLHDAKELSELIFQNASKILRTYYSDLQWNAFMSFYSIEAIRNKITTQQVFCAIQSSTIVGTIALEQDFVVGFYTRVQNLNQGIGKLLMNHIVLTAQQQGLAQIQLAASPAAQTFYEKQGWQMVHPIFPKYANVEFEETLMRKSLL